MGHLRDSQKARFALCTALAIGFLLMGCASMSKREKVRRRFQEMHGCNEASVGRSLGSGGYTRHLCGVADEDKDQPSA